jgi:hypothetical protein
MEMENKVINLAVQVNKYMKFPRPIANTTLLNHFVAQHDVSGCFEQLNA